MSLFKHFYRQPYQTKISLLSQLVQLSDQANQLLTDSYSATGNQLIENYITDYELPEGVAVNLIVNGRESIAPMVTEEPSVIAAASNGARLLGKAGGTTVEVLGQNLMGQIVLKTTESNLVIGFVHTHKNELLIVANQAHPSILQYGGGAQQLRVRKLDDEYVSIDLFVNVGEAMGANIMNSMLESVASYLEPKLPQTVLMSILSNYADNSLVKVTGQVPIQFLGTSEISGRKVAKNIAEASHVAQIDVYRATTHNKGIMNGIDAVVMAMGNDWRAVEAGIHAYASHDGKYRGLSTWHLEGSKLVGTMTLPLALGFVGGATKVFPKVKINQQLAQINSKTELMELVASVGLAQNLAALKALVTEGIQKGHMNLQLNSLAMTAGAQPHEVAEVVIAMKKKNSSDLATAQKILKQIRETNKGD
jgi:hydroxymethylglutaryl-CoA reductase